jgi:hypothetical protein
MSVCVIVCVHVRFTPDSMVHCRDLNPMTSKRLGPPPVMIHVLGFTVAGPRFESWSVLPPRNWLHWCQMWDGILEAI